MPDAQIYPCDWVDAFTDRAYGGNGCVVVHGADDISIEDRLALVRETSLSECAFVVTSELADFGARYYLTEKEIPMAGHPTIATVASLIHRGLVDMSSGCADFSLEVGAGVLPITVRTTAQGHEISMTQLRPTFGRTYEPADLAAIYGLHTTDIIATPQTVSTGSPFCIVLLKDKDTLGRAVLDADKLAGFRADSDADFLEPFLVTLGGRTPSGDVFSRLLLPPPMPPEDPFTGSATGCMAAYLWAYGLIQRRDFTAEQGHDMGRPGQASVQVLGPQNDISGIKVSGTAHILMSGSLHL